MLGVAVAFRARSLPLPSWTRRMRSQTLMRMAGTSTTSYTCLCELGAALPAHGTGRLHLLIPPKD